MPPPHTHTHSMAMQRCGRARPGGKGSKRKTPPSEGIQGTREEGGKGGCFCSFVNQHCSSSPSLPSSSLPLAMQHRRTIPSGDIPFPFLLPPAPGAPPLARSSPPFPFPLADSGGYCNNISFSKGVGRQGSKEGRGSNWAHL